MERIRCEVDNNLPKVRRGLPAKYREDAKFVLKVLPDMERDKAYFNRRVAAKMAEGRKKNRLSRHDFPKERPDTFIFRPVHLWPGSIVFPGKCR